MLYHRVVSLFPEPGLSHQCHWYLQLDIVRYWCRLSCRLSSVGSRRKESGKILRPWKYVLIVGICYSGDLSQHQRTSQSQGKVHFVELEIPIWIKIKTNKFWLWIMCLHELLKFKRKERKRFLLNYEWWNSTSFFHFLLKMNCELFSGFYFDQSVMAPWLALSTEKYFGWFKKLFLWNILAHSRFPGKLSSVLYFSSKHSQRCLLDRNIDKTKDSRNIYDI